MAQEHELTHAQEKRLAGFVELFRVKPGTKVTLAKDFDPAFKGGVKKKRVERGEDHRGGGGGGRITYDKDDE